MHSSTKTRCSRRRRSASHRSRGRTAPRPSWPAVIVNVMDFCPAVCAAPFNVHCEKVYPAGSVAGAVRFTLVPSATPGTRVVRRAAVARARTDAQPGRRRGLNGQCRGRREVLPQTLPDVVLWSAEVPVTAVRFA